MNQKIADVPKIESNQRSPNELGSTLRTEKIEGYPGEITHLSEIKNLFPVIT